MRTLLCAFLSLRLVAGRFLLPLFVNSEPQKFGVFSGKTHPFTRIPAAYALLFFSPKHVYQIHTEPQIHAKGEKKFWPRAKMLGGCKFQLVNLGGIVS